MVGSVPFLGAAVIALLITGYRLCTHKASGNVDGEDASNMDMGSLLAVFAIVFFVSFFVIKMVTDSSDNTQMFNNIKVGEPPF